MRSAAIELKAQDKLLSGGESGWVRVDRFMSSAVKVLIQENCWQTTKSNNEPSRVNYSVQKWDDALFAYVNPRRVDPFLEWLEALPDWDKNPRLEKLLEKVFKVHSPPEVLKYTSRLPLIGAIARAYHPGHKCDIMTLLKGPQGPGKSTYWKELLPSSDYFSDSLDLSAKNKERAENILGKVFVESAELTGMGRRYMEDLKAFLTREKDTYRPAYGRYTEDFKRRCVFVGSTNNKNFLPNDPSGSRRFLVAEIEPLCVENQHWTKQYLDENREQIWAEAIFFYHQKKERPYIPATFREGIEAENEKFIDRPYEWLYENVEKWLLEKKETHSEFSETQQELLKEFLDVDDWKRNKQGAFELKKALETYGGTSDRQRGIGVVWTFKF